MPDRPQQPALTRLGSNLPKPVKKAIAVARLWSALQANQLSPEEQQKASVQMTQTKDKTNNVRTTERWISDIQRTAAIEQPDTYTGGLNKKPEEEETSLDVSQQSQDKNKRPSDYQPEGQSAPDSESEELSNPALGATSLAAPSRKRAPSPLEKRRMLEQIKNKETEIADLEGKTSSTRRKEKMDKITKDIIKMAALSETILGSIYYLIKILVREGFAHKDGTQVKKLKQQITERKDELTSLKSQARQMQVTR